MPLTEEDIKRIERLGYRREEFVVIGPDGIPRLRNINGHCFFLDPFTGRCKIYAYRPVGCRLYPLVYVPGKGVVVDPYCPRARSIPKTLIKKYEKYVVELIKKIYGENMLQ
jgi:Fe-S-cluster containining protein